MRLQYAMAWVSVPGVPPGEHWLVVKACRLRAMCSAREA